MLRNGIYQPNTRTMVVGNAVTPFGCCNYFDNCADEIMTLSYQGALGLLDWLAFRVTDECYRSMEFITYKRPEQSGGRDTPGYLGDPCGDPNGYEIGARKITVEDFGLIGRSGPTRDGRMSHVKYCKLRPMYRLDGTPITSEDEWDLRNATDQIIDDVATLVINGDVTVAGQFDGLEQWVSATHGGSLNSYVVDWNGNPLTGGAGITINGGAIAATYDFIDVLLALFRNIRTRMSWSRMLSTAMMQSVAGDHILVVPSALKDCILDFYTCWSVCTGQQYNEANLQTYEARAFRDNLVSADNPFNVYGHGYITLDGTVIPLMTHDWGLINSETQFDCYFLTGSVGPVRVFEGEMLSAQEVANNMNSDSQGGYRSIDGERLLVLKDTENLCKEIKVWHSPRLFCMAPWMQIRFQDLQCGRPGGPLSADPSDTSFYPESSFSAAECP